MEAWRTIKRETKPNYSSMEIILLTERERERERAALSKPKTHKKEKRKENINYSSQNCYSR